MAMTGHRSVAAAIGYFQVGAAADNLAARLLDGGHTPVAPALSSGSP